MASLVTRYNSSIFITLTRNCLYNIAPMGVNSCHQVRWRKRRWAPKNASKIFYVPEKVRRSPEDEKVWRTKKQHYNTTLKAIRNLFTSELRAAQSSSETELLKVKEIEEWEAILEKNCEWNKKTAITREARQKREEEWQEEQMLELAIKKDEEKQKQLCEAVKLVQQEQDEAERFVDVNQLELEIEQALNKRHNYNFVIDRDGTFLSEQADGSTSEENLKDTFHKSHKIIVNDEKSSNEKSSTAEIKT